MWQDRTWLAFWGFMAGVVVSAANVLQFLGGQAAGCADPQIARKLSKYITGVYCMVFRVVPHCGT